MADAPLSPHLQIYKPQLTSTLSILHRGTGIFLSLGSLLLCYWLLSLASGPQTYTQVSHHANEWYGKILLILFIFSLYYHLCNGIRHLFWDIGLGLEIDSAYRTGYLVILFTAILTILSCYLAWGGAA